MVSLLDSGSSSPDSSSGQDHCVVEQDPFLSKCLSPTKGINGYRQSVRTM